LKQLCDNRSWPVQAFESAFRPGAKAEEHFPVHLYGVQLVHLFIARNKEENKLWFTANSKTNSEIFTFF
jgi:hypothetical protein